MMIPIKRSNARRLFSLKKCFALLCISLFTIQVTELTMEYYKGKTVVNIEIGQLFQEGPPGITICPAGLDIAKMATINDEYKKLHQDYVEGTFNSTDSLFIHSYHKKVYNDISQGFLSLADIFNNYTFNYEEELSREKIRLELVMATDNDDESMTGIPANDTSFNVSHAVLKPITSFSYDGYFIHKCFTFFSRLNSNGEYLKNFLNFKILFELDKHKYMWRTMMIVLHSPNDLPFVLYTSATLLTKNRSYITRAITYKIERLGHQYDTDCINYERDSDFLTRHDCIKSCYIARLNRLCNGTALMRFGFLRQTGSNHSQYAPCPMQMKMYMHIYAKCTKSCRMNCHETYYSQRFDRESVLINETLLVITKDWKTPDLTIRYIPKMSFMSFVCNFGGLLGMWLGLSFVHIINTMLVCFNNVIISKLNVHFNQFNLDSAFCNGPSRNQFY